MGSVEFSDEGEGEDFVESESREVSVREFGREDEAIGIVSKPD